MPTENLTSSVRIHRVLIDPTASNWLKRSLETAVQRDCVDALNDAELLTDILNQRMREVSGKDPQEANPVLPILLDLEKRRRSDEGNADWIFRLCQGIVASHGGFTKRTDWAPIVNRMLAEETKAGEEANGKG